MRNHTLLALALALITAAPATAQTAAARRAALQRETGLRAALEARAAQNADVRRDLEAALQEARARRTEASEFRSAELEAALEAARMRQAEASERHLELEAALDVERDQRARAEQLERQAREQAREAARANRERQLERQLAELERDRAEREGQRAERERAIEREPEAAVRAERAREESVREGQRLALEAALAAEAGQLDLWLDRIGGEGPAEAWAPQDPADSLWRQARARLNGRDFAEAVRLFRRIRTEPRFSNSEYRPDAFYWEAFALARRGGAEALREAKQVLEELERAYPPDRRSPDAEALAARIDAELAGQGHAEAARSLYERLAVAGTVPPATPARAAAVAEAEVLQRAAEARAAGVAGTTAVESMLRAAQERRASGMYSGQLAGELLRGQYLASAAQTRRQCQTDEEEIRLIALNALMKMSDTAALPALREVLARRDECAPQFRRHAMMILTRRDSPGTESILLQAAREDPDAEVRLLALSWLIEKENSQAFDVAESILETATDAALRQAAIQALARSRSERARQILRDFVRSDAPVQQRGEALMALPRTGSAADAAFLRQLYGETKDRQLKEYALMTLGRRELEGDADWLLGIARNEAESMELRVQALMQLRTESGTAVAPIAEVYDQARDRRLREAALTLLMERSRSDAAALDKVIAVAQSEEDAELRKLAVVTLSRSRDPRAQAVLLEILRNR